MSDKQQHDLPSFLSSVSILQIISPCLSEKAIPTINPLIIKSLNNDNNKTDTLQRVIKQSTKDILNTNHCHHVKKAIDKPRVSFLYQCVKQWKRLETPIPIFSKSLTSVQPKEVTATCTNLMIRHIRSNPKTNTLSKKFVVGEKVKIKREPISFTGVVHQGLLQQCSYRELSLTSMLDMPFSSYRHILSAMKHKRISFNPSLDTLNRFRDKTGMVLKNLKLLQDQLQIVF